jgi:hypothetical protein
LEYLLKTFEHDYETITSEQIVQMLQFINTKECNDTYLIPTEITEASIKAIFNNLVDINPEDLKGQTEGRIHVFSGKKED